MQFFDRNNEMERDVSDDEFFVTYTYRKGLDSEDSLSPTFIDHFAKFTGYELSSAVDDGLIIKEEEYSYAGRSLTVTPLADGNVEVTANFDLNVYDDEDPHGMEPARNEGYKYI